MKVCLPPSRMRTCRACHKNVVSDENDAQLVLYTSTFKCNKFHKLDGNATLTKCFNNGKE